MEYIKTKCKQELPNKARNPNIKQKISTRTFNQENTNNFKCDLEISDWSSLQSWYKFYVQQIYKYCANPVR